MSPERLAAFDAALLGRGGGPAAAVAELERVLAAAGLQTAPGPLLKPDRNRALIQARQCMCGSFALAWCAGLLFLAADGVHPHESPPRCPPCRPASTAAAPTEPWPTWRCCPPTWRPGLQ